MGLVTDSCGQVAARLQQPVPAASYRPQHTSVSALVLNWANRKFTQSINSYLLTRYHMLAAGWGLTWKAR
jgi:hypothetical protein